MGNNTSKAVSRTQSTTKLIHSPKHKRKNKSVSVGNKRTNSEVKGQSAIDKLPEANPHTLTDAQYRAMFSPQSPAGVVGRLKGWTFVFPFSSLMNQWTDGEWPYEGAFDRDKLQIAEYNVNPDFGNPSWDSAYMKDCVNVWLTVARQRCGVSLDEKRVDRFSDEFRAAVENCVKCVTACHLPMLEAELQTRATEMMKIKQRHGENVKAISKAIIYGWAKRQTDAPSPQTLLTIVSKAGVPLQESHTNKTMISIFPQLSPSNPFSAANMTDQTISQQAKTDDEFLLLAAAVEGQRLQTEVERERDSQAARERERVKQEKKDRADEEKARKAAEKEKKANLSFKQVKSQKRKEKKRHLAAVAEETEIDTQDSSGESEVELELQGARGKGEESDTDHSDDTEPAVRPKMTQRRPHTASSKTQRRGTTRMTHSHLERHTRSKTNILEPPLNITSTSINAPKIMVGNTAVCKPWTPAEIVGMTQNAPNPTTNPDEYWGWLRYVCSVYNCLIPDVEQLLAGSYRTEWDLCKGEFLFPARTEDGQWPPHRTMIDWLNEEAKTAIRKCARQRTDFNKVIHCVQGAYETVPEFVNRFTRTWDSNAGIGREGNEYFVVTTFVQNLKPNVAAAYKLSVTDWQTKDWKATVNKMMALDRCEVFAEDKSASFPKQMLQHARQGGGQQHFKNNNKRKPGKCHKCGKAGHWANECRSGRRQNKQNYPFQDHQTRNFQQTAPLALPQQQPLPPPPHVDNVNHGQYYNQA